MAENRDRSDNRSGEKKTGERRGGERRPGENRAGEQKNQSGEKRNQGGTGGKDFGGKGGSRNRRRNNRRRGNNKQKGKRFFTTSETYVCPICGQNVRDVLTAIAFGEQKTPAHFDCVVKDLAGKEELKNKEKIVYLGKGEFGVVKFKGNNGNKFEIIRRLPMEDHREGPLTWRKEISKQLKK